ncbi:MAG: efflux RND transporter periplasmic adaptor subunit [Pseudomonadales bacterium]
MLKQPSAYPRLLITIIATLLSITAKTDVLAQTKTAVVEVAPVEMRTMAAQIWVPGTVISLQDASIASEISGRLNWVPRVGTHIKAGAALAKIDQRELQLELQRNQSAVKRIEAERAYQARQIARLERLTDQHNSARAELDEARSRNEVLEQNLISAQLAVKSSQLLLEKATPRAPYNGVVAERTANTGEYIQTGSPLLRFVNTETLEVSARAPISTANYNLDGIELIVKSDLQQAVSRLRAVVPIGDRQSRMLELRLTLENSPWLIGEAVRVGVNEGNSSNTLTVPRDALVLRQSGISVFAIDDESNARQVKVQLGAADGDLIAVKGDLSQSDVVVIRGAENLQAGQAVERIRKRAASVE